MAGMNPGGISRSNIGTTWGHGWMALLAKHTKLIILCLHAKKLIYHVINYAKMVILWVNIRVRSPPSWNSVFWTTWLRFSSQLRFRTRARNPVGPRPVHHWHQRYFNSCSIVHGMAANKIIKVCKLSPFSTLQRSWNFPIWKTRAQPT